MDRGAEGLTQRRGWPLRNNEVPVLPALLPSEEANRAHSTLTRHPDATVQPPLDVSRVLNSPLKREGILLTREDMEPIG